MSNIDKRNRLDEIDDFGKQVKILKGKEADQFISKANAAENEKALQLVMAKVTGNFKRGNERNNHK